MNNTHHRLGAAMLAAGITLALAQLWLATTGHAPNFSGLSLLALALGTAGPILLNHKPEREEPK